MMADPTILFTTVIVGVLIVAQLAALVLLFKERRERAAAHQRETDSFRRIAEVAGDVAFEYDPARNQFSWTADLGAILLGYSEGELPVHLDLFDGLVHAEDKPTLIGQWENLERSGRVGMEFRMQQKDGRWCWLHIDAVPQTDKSGRIRRAVGLIRKTQALHETQAALAEARRLDTIGTMAGGIAHEFNNHLTPIRGYLELALDDLKPDHAVADGLRTALERVECCADLVAQVQAYGRKSIILPKPLDVGRVLPGIVRMALSLHRQEQENISLVEQIPESLPAVLLDRGQFQQAMIHLVRNAMEAMHHGGLMKVSAEEVYIHKQQPGGPDHRSGRFVCIKVEDTGEGIRPEHQPHIFDPFFTTRGRARSRGMGLPMVQGVMAQHNGWIEIQSTMGVGTHVRLYFPINTVKTGPASGTGADRDGTMPVLPAAQAGLVLVADDEKSIRDLVRRVFENEGWCVKEASDSTEVISYLTEERAKVDLLVLDLSMPGPPVEESVHIVNTVQPHTKIIIMSGFAKDERVEKLHEEAGVEFISKPFSPKDILSVVDNILAARV